MVPGFVGFRGAGVSNSSVSQRHVLVIPRLSMYLSLYIYTLTF